MAYLGRSLDKISNIEILDNITFDGSSSYSITKGSVAFIPNSAQSLLISIDGVVQATNFTVSSSTIDFGVAIPSTSVCNFFLHYGTGVMTVPSDGSVTTAKLGDDAVTGAKLSYPLTTFSSTGIDDNADATAITIDSSERVGIGETSPSSKLHIVGSDATTQFKIEHSSASNAVLIGEDSSSNLRIYTGGAERMRIDSSGNVLIGTTSSNAKLIVNDNKTGSEASPHISIDGNGYAGYHWLDTDAYYIGQNSNARNLRIYGGSNENDGVNLSPGGNSWGSYSDERLKKDITDLTNGLDKISAMRPVNFKYKSDADDYRIRIGIIAQSLVGKVDEALDQTKRTSDDETKYYNVRYQDLIPVLVKGMQEQQTKIQELEARITALEGK